MLFQQLPHTYRSPFSTGKLPRICGSVFLKKHALLQLRRCQNTQPRRGRESSVRRVGGFYRGSPASIQTCIVKRPVNTRLSDADSANTRPRLVIAPWLLGLRSSCSDPVDQKPAAAFLADIIYEARNSSPSQLLLP